MRISTLNLAVLVQLAGLLMLLPVAHSMVKVAGVTMIVIGGVLYRREQERLKAEMSLRTTPDG